VEQLAAVTPADALNHPTWEMGPKITVDSATLMNKGLEVIEAHWLFGLPAEQIDVVIHPQSIVHSMVEFIDGSVMAQMGVNDMKHPIQYALSHPERARTGLPALDLLQHGRLEFQAVDREKFPCLELAYQALRQGGLAPVALNAANEVAVAAFLEGRLPFSGIAQVVGDVLQDGTAGEAGSLEEIAQADGDARRLARRQVERRQAS
jgi:1-deoxy-D-xylulose-5-phosphate reductoisomerase